MELELKDGRYVAGRWGGVSTVSGQEEKIQRIMMRLAAHRGGFLPMPHYGSRIYTLGGVKASGRDAAARQFVHEALAEEDGVTVTEVKCSMSGHDTLRVDVALSLFGESLEMSFDV